MRLQAGKTKCQQHTRVEVVDSSASSEGLALLKKESELSF